MKYRFMVEKKSFEIEIANTTTFHSQSELKVENRRIAVALAETLSDDELAFFADNHYYRVAIVRDEGGYPVGIYINDEYFDCALQKIDNLFYYKPKKEKTQRSGIVRSFIPGHIKNVFFKEGDTVKENDIVLIHEAMKMENEIRAPRSGVLLRLGVKEGDNILANHLLFEVGDR